MAYGDVKNVIIDKFLLILAVLVIRDVQKQFFYEIKNFVHFINFYEF